MATKQTRTLARLMVAPSVAVLLVWMIVPLALTLWFSFQNYNILRPERQSFAGFDNFQNSSTLCRKVGSEERHHSSFALVLSAEAALASIT